MGLLDDAIREHLELKRRHGASEAEVDHLADEVFGEAQTAAPAEPAPEPEGSETPEAAPERVDEREPEPEPTAPEPEAIAPEPEMPERAPDEVAPPPAPEPAPPRSFTDDEPWLEEPDEVPADEALDHRHQPTQEHPAPTSGAEDEYVAPDEGPEGEDVLEETPEFLQETPEHDRLWFEQKPPRDFDFGS